MRRQKRRQVTYTTFALHDGTVVLGCPKRKPTPRTLKAEGIGIDEDGVCREWIEGTKEFSDLPLESRIRFQSVIANRLNTRRVVREMIVPHLIKLQADVEALRGQIGQIQGSLTNRQTGRLDI
jgi:hypothetical protein